MGQIPRVNLEVLYGYINAWDAMQSSACAQEIEKEKKGWIQKRSSDMVARLLAADGCSHFRKE